MFDHIVVGAGLSGAVIAERIANVLGKRVLVVEKRDHIGGNCYDERNEHNILVHRYGPHLFHTDNKEVVDYLSRFTEWEVYHHKVLAHLDGNLTPIPFNFNTIEDLFPPTLARKLEESLLRHFSYGMKVPILELKKSDDEHLRFLADYVYEKVFVHYTAKQWGMKPEEMDSAVTARVPIFVGRDDRYFNDRYQMLPKAGYTSLFRRMLSHPEIKLLLNTDFKEICQLREDGIYLFGSKFTGRIVYTGALDELFDYEFGELPYRSVDMRFETLKTESYQPAATVNYPNEYDFTRITEFKKIHPVPTPFTTILKEYPQAHVPGETTPYYPIFAEEAQRAYRKYREKSEKFSQLIPIGRLAEYRYYDMDDAVANALQIFEERLNLR